MRYFLKFERGEDCMLIFLSNDDYPTAKAESYPQYKLCARCRRPLSIRAAMDGMGDKYDMASLKGREQRQMHPGTKSYQAGQGLCQLHKGRVRHPAGRGTTVYGSGPSTERRRKSQLTPERDGIGMNFSGLLRISCSILVQGMQDETHRC